MMKDIWRQTNLLAWKRSIEVWKQPSELISIIVSIVILSLELTYLYSASPDKERGSLEIFLVPVIVTSFSQRTLTAIIYEKCNWLLESMRMMGLRLPSYWMSYFIR
jgi:hypothetical protein